MVNIKKFFKNLGPGLITGASDDDPSGIATYSQAGALFGLSTLDRLAYVPVNGIHSVYVRTHWFGKRPGPHRNHQETL